MKPTKKEFAFGEQWKSQIMRIPKKELTEMLAKVCEENLRLKARFRNEFYFCHEGFVMNAEQSAYAAFALTHPVESFEHDKRKFCDFVRTRNPAISDEQIEKLVNKESK